MFTHLVWAAMIGMLVTTPIEASDRGQPKESIRIPNFNLIGVTTVLYGTVFHTELFNDTQQYRCKFDRDAWDAVMDSFAASQSTKLKLVRNPMTEQTYRPPGPE
jgi:hypothetical protein